MHGYAFDSAPIMNHIVVHYADSPEIYENPLIEKTITGLLGHFEKPT